MPLTTAGANKILDALGASHASLHTADPGDTGLNEVVGGSYARKAISWSAAAAKNLDSSTTPTFDVPAATTITHVAFWDAVSAGTCLAVGDITDETFGSAGTYQLTDADISLT